MSVGLVTSLSGVALTKHIVVTLIHDEVQGMRVNPVVTLHTCQSYFSLMVGLSQ